MITGLSTKKLQARNRRARRNLALKMSLEARFAPEIDRYFNFITEVVTDIILGGGSTDLPEEIQISTVALLRRQYRRVAKAFTDEMRLFIKKSIDIEETKQNGETEEEEGRISKVISALTGIFIVRQSAIRSVEIDKTTREDIQASVQEASSEILDSGSSLTQKTLSVLVAEKLKRKFLSRKKTLNITETQFSSESVKEIEAAVVGRGGEVGPISADTFATSGQVFGNPETKKEWAAILDQVTRPAHVQADGQERSITDPFNVGGELLPKPGDSSLGASAGNVINCRCSALYST